MQVYRSDEEFLSWCNTKQRWGPVNCTALLFLFLPSLPYSLLLFFLILQPRSSTVFESTKMAQNFSANITSATSMEDTLLASFIFKSIEVGSLNPENAMATLEKYGIPFSINRDYFYMDPSRNYDANLAESHIFNNNFDNNYNNNTSGKNNNISNDGDNINNNKKNDKKSKKNNNINNLNGANFAEFIANPSKAWTNNLSDPNERDNDANTNLLAAYIKLLDVTSSSSRLKRLPKFITYVNAKVHLNEIFVPRIVCLLCLFLHTYILYRLFPVFFAHFSFFRSNHCLAPLRIF